MTKMNTNANIPKAPQAPALPKGKPAAPRKIVVAAKPKPPAAPKAPPPKPGSSQKDFSEVTKNARKPGGTMLPKPPPNPGKK